MVKLIIFSGIDGSGKSTHAKILYKYAIVKRIKARYVWLRSFSFTTYALLLYARLAKKTVVLEASGVGRAKLRVRIFWLDPVLRALYPRFLLFDLLVKFLAVLLYADIRRIDLLIVDRFLMDALIDLVYGVRDSSFLKSLIARTCLTLINKYRRNHIVFLVDPRAAIRRKNDIISFREISFKYVLFKVLAESMNIKLWDTTEKPVSTTSRVVLEHFRDITKL